MSTTERHFSLKTKEMSLVIAANDITAVFLTVPLIFYFNKKNKAFWTGIGQLVAALANFLPLLAYLCIPSSYVDTQIEKEDVQLCDRNADVADEDCLNEDSVPADWKKIIALGCF